MGSEVHRNLVAHAVGQHPIFSIIYLRGTPQGQAGEGRVEEDAAEEEEEEEEEEGEEEEGVGPVPKES